MLYKMASSLSKGLDEIKPVKITESQCLKQKAIKIKGPKGVVEGITDGDEQIWRGPIICDIILEVIFYMRFFLHS